MEESKASVITATDSAAASSAPVPSTAAAGSTVTTKKRPLESDISDDSHSNYFKMRSVIRDIRPYFVEVLRTPDFKNSKASQEIRELLKVVVKLYENMKADAALLGKSKQDGQSNMDHKTQQEQQPQHIKSPEQIQVEKSFARSSESKLPAPGLQKLQAEDGQGTYVVGGSAFGWNFITFSGKDAVYYGRTKEEYRSAK